MVSFPGSEETIQGQEVARGAQVDARGGQDDIPLCLREGSGASMGESF